MNVRNPRFPLFDSLRAIAALSVVAFHAAYYQGFLAPGHSLSRYYAQLNIGVAIFFVISGFLLYRPFAQTRLSRAEFPGPRDEFAAHDAWRRGEGLPERDPVRGPTRSPAPVGMPV